MKHWHHAAPVAVVAALMACGAAAQTAPAHWVGPWAAAPIATFAPRPGQPGRAGRTFPGSVLNNQTVRMIVRTSLGGSAVRLRFSNAFGKQAVTLGDVHVALAGEGAAITDGSDHAVLFDGQASIVIPPGADVLSDAVAMTVPPLTHLAVSVYVPVSSGPVTWHLLTNQTNYIAGDGDFASQTAMPGAAPFGPWDFLTEVEVAAAPGSYAVVCLGDSITAGAHSTRNANNDWTDIMADHLPRVGVLNEGISGNRILHDDNGPNALARFPRDVLELAGVRDLIVFEGINDIAFPDGKTPSHRTQRVSPEEMTGALQQIVDRAHAHGIHVYGATITPYIGQSAETPRGEAEREAVNAWIRTPGHFDGVIDFDKVMRDPQHQDQIRPGYGFSDHLHPSPAGYLAMGLEAAKVMAAAASKSD